MDMTGVFPGLEDYAKRQERERKREELEAELDRLDGEGE